jgi:hypothetical protein
VGGFFNERKGLVLQAFDREVVWDGVEMKTVTIILYTSSGPAWAYSGLNNGNKCLLPRDVPWYLA